jgi:carboxypeptidase Taq
MPSAAYTKLSQQLLEITHLNACLALLQWDQEILMPSKGVDPRAKLIASLSVLNHDKWLALNEKKALTGLVKWAKSHSSTKEACVIRETHRTYERERKLPVAFVQELSALSSKAQHVWAEARAQSNFAHFLPSLKRLIDLKRKEAEYLGYKESPYDALLDGFEPGLTSSQLSTIFGELRDFLKPFLRQLQAKTKELPEKKMVQGTFPLEQQATFNRAVIQEIGFDFEAGRLDTSTHPFTTNFHPHDVRITTRYSEQNALYALGSTIHEMGHALYEQGLSAKEYGTPLGEALSLSIHESQSRFWENNIGKSRAFWQHFYPKLQKQFPKPFARLPLETFYRFINRVEPSFIRTESDEVSYNLHIILRYEIERGLIEGSLKAKDLSEIWNAKIKEYLGIKVPNDRLGVLQDVHWSIGAIGYFPTYALGNLYAAQFLQAIKRDLPTLDNDLRTGSFSNILKWLRTNIHVHGKRYSADALVRRVSGEPLQAKYFIQYLQEKYTDVYKPAKG